MEWHLIGAAVQGKSHIATGTRCQDACHFEVVGETALIALSDGAGSASLAHLGANLVVKSTIDLLRERRLMHALNINDMRDALDFARSEIKKDSQERDVALREYSATALIVAASPNHTVFAQVGDGAIVGRVTDELELKALTWPQQGEYANTTVFLVSDEYEPIISETGGLTEIAVFSDGLQNVALSFSKNAPFSPFFAPFFTALRKDDRDLGELDKQLASYFANDAQLATRTDDDLSLIIGVRS